jgi:hypothetical protein
MAMNESLRFLIWFLQQDIEIHGSNCFLIRGTTKPVNGMQLFLIFKANEYAEHYSKHGGMDDTEKARGKMGRFKTGR